MATDFGDCLPPLERFFPRRREPSGAVDLPHYALDIQLDLPRHEVRVLERVTWTNVHRRPTSELVFNVHARYDIRQDQEWYQAKMLEILRLTPSEFIDLEGPIGDVRRVSLSASSNAAARIDGGLHFAYDEKMPTALRVQLPRPVQSGESITVDVEYVLRLPQRKGRISQWKGITSLTDWLPVLAHYGDEGWEPVPFVFYHQAVFQEAGIYSAKITLPRNERIAR